VTAGIVPVAGGACQSEALPARAPHHDRSVGGGHRSPGRCAL